MSTDTTNLKGEGMPNVMGHPAGLFILFFTEMWERFSYYGMRALLVLFLVSAAGLGGWEWSNADALELYALYTGLVYITPILGGFIADKYMGFRNAIVLGALLMTLGHASMAFETPFTFYLGLALLIIGNGFFKPNISSMVGDLYKGQEKKKDAGYTIFYMGINAGAFLGIFLCGYIGEKVGWSYGFGLAGIFMFFGLLQFYYSQKIFDQIGLKPLKKKTGVKDVYQELKAEAEYQANASKDNDTKQIEEAVSKELPNIEAQEKKSLLHELKSRFHKKIVNDRLIVISILAFFTIFFWMAFEQAGGSMTIFAKDFTDRVLSGSWAQFFTVFNAILAIVPLAVITWVLIMLIRKTYKKYALANLFLSFSFLIIWIVVVWMVNKEFKTKAYTAEVTQEVQKDYHDTLLLDHKITHAEALTMLQEKDTLASAKGIDNISITEAKGALFSTDSTQYLVHIQYTVSQTDVISIRHDAKFDVGQNVAVIDLDNSGKFKYLTEEEAEGIRTVLQAQILSEKDNEIEVPASWFGVLNSLFIIIFAPLFSKLWESKLNPSAPIKFAIGLILLGLGFGVLAIGASGISGDDPVMVSMIWLIVAYLLHTLGELTLSPVGLSYVSKLSPPKLVGLMFGIWFTATAVANFLAGQTGSMIDKISEEYSLSTFFLIFFFIPVIAGIILIILNKWLKKKMHGIE